MPKQPGREQRLGNLLGHSVDVHCHPGKGSVFAVEVPLGREQPGELPQRRQSGAAQNAGCDATILVVEHDPSVRKMLDLLFAGEGYPTADAADAADGKEAVALARGAIRPDLVVVDYDLPNSLNGLQVVSGVREAIRRQIPAVILTGDISTGIMREITQRDCVQRNKSIRAEELTHLIESILVESRQPTVQPDPLPQAESKDDMLQPTIFVVDDEASAREAMRGLLQEDG